jgi:magnesium chelatase subunit H
MSCWSLNINQSSLTKACNAIHSGKEGVAVEAVGYLLLEELRNPNVLEQFKADVADANIFIGSLIFSPKNLLTR